MRDRKAQFSLLRGFLDSLQLFSLPGRNNEQAYFRVVLFEGIEIFVIPDAVGARARPYNNHGAFLFRGNGIDCGDAADQSPK
jgi:hypothetical protein